jgi:hypothetical protein
MAGQTRDERDTATTQIRTGADAVLQSGLRAVVTTASLVGAFSLCMPAVDRLFAAPPSLDGPQIDEAAPTTADAVLSEVSDAADAASATPQVATHIAFAPNAVAVNATTETPVESAPPIPAEAAFTRLSLDLSASRFTADGHGGANGFALHAPPRARASAWRSRAEAFVPDWQTPVVRDLSLFVANDDEALSWSFSRASPNYGRVSYQEERVEIGKLAAGVSIALDDMQLALAYVEREQPSQLGYTAHEDYAGLIWTFRR